MMLFSREQSKSSSLDFIANAIRNSLPLEVFQLYFFSSHLLPYIFLLSLIIRYSSKIAFTLDKNNFCFLFLIVLSYLKHNEQLPVIFVQTS